MEKQTFNSREAAGYLCVSHSKMMKLFHMRQIAYSKCGRRNVVTRQQLDDYLARHIMPTEEELQKQAEQRLLNNKKHKVC